MLDNVNCSKLTELVSAFPDKILKAKNPCEAAKVAALVKNGMLLGALMPTTERAIFTALNQNGLALKFVENQTTKMKWAALKQNVFALEFAKGPSYDMKKYAVEREGLCIEFIPAPSQELWNIAIDSDGEAIKFLTTPTETQKVSAVRCIKDILPFIKDPSDHLLMEAVKSNGISIKSVPVEKQNKLFQITAVTSNPHSIEFIEYPFEDVQVKAVEQIPIVIRKIKNPTQRALEIARNRGVAT